MRMKKQNRKVLVHCAAGVSRSASFVIAYIMKSRKIGFDEAYTFVKSKRPIITPNSGFVKQLK
jgi:protein-tyrosine phosphatase